MYYTTKNIVCQACVSKNIPLTPDNEVKSKFEPKKEQSLILSDSYERIGYDNKALSVRSCGDFLEFAKVGNDFKLHKACFCKDKLCPMCSWRRTYKIFGQVSQIMQNMPDNLDYVFVTLTVPNCSAENLLQLVDDMQGAWHRFVHYKNIQRAFKGFFRCLEVTHNTVKNSPSYDTYHPHFHVIFAVEKYYFTSRDYITHDELLRLWQKAMRDDTITQVDIRRVKPKELIDKGERSVKALSSAVAEVSKYSVKSADYLGRVDKKSGRLVAPFSDDFIDRTVACLTSALHKRRLTAFGGIFADIRDSLNLDDAENGDLLHINGELRDDVAIQIYRYGWSCGAYKLIEITSKGGDIDE